MAVTYGRFVCLVFISNKTSGSELRSWCGKSSELELQRKQSDDIFMNLQYLFVCGHIVDDLDVIREMSMIRGILKYGRDSVSLLSYR